MTKILLVEDDKSLREIYGVRLQAEGYDITSAGDGEEALAAAMQQRPDLIISDVMMPKISGFDMLDILRQTPETRDTKVIMMTALSSEDQRERGNNLGADRYLVKSQVGIEDVIRTVHEVLGDAPAPAPAPVTPAVPDQAPVPTPEPAADVSAFAMPAMPTPQAVAPGMEPLAPAQAPVNTMPAPEMPAPAPETDGPVPAVPADEPVMQPLSQPSTQPAGPVDFASAMAAELGELNAPEIASTDPAPIAPEPTPEVSPLAHDDAMDTSVPPYLDPQSDMAPPVAELPAMPTPQAELPQPPAPEATPENQPPKPQFGGW